MKLFAGILFGAILAVLSPLRADETSLISMPQFLSGE